MMVNCYLILAILIEFLMLESVNLLRMKEINLKEHPAVAIEMIACEYTLCINAYRL